MKAVEKKGKTLVMREERRRVGRTIFSLSSLPFFPPLHVTEITIQGQRERKRES